MRKKSLTCVCPFVDLKIFRPCKYFAATREWAWKGLLAGVYPDMVHKFVFGFKRFPFAGTLFPKADMIRLLRSTNVLHRNVRYQLVHGAVRFRAKFFCSVLRLRPLAD